MAEATFFAKEDGIAEASFSIDDAEATFFASEVGSSTASAELGSARLETDGELVVALFTSDAVESTSALGTTEEETVDATLLARLNAREAADVATEAEAETAANVLAVTDGGWKASQQQCSDTCEGSTDRDGACNSVDGKENGLLKQHGAREEVDAGQERIETGQGFVFYS